jgi:hypothetical protein
MGYTNKCIYDKVIISCNERVYCITTYDVKFIISYCVVLYTTAHVIKPCNSVSFPTTHNIASLYIRKYDSKPVSRRMCNYVPLHIRIIMYH